MLLWVAPLLWLVTVISPALTDGTVIAPGLAAWRSPTGRCHSRYQGEMADACVSVLLPRLPVSHRSRCRYRPPRLVLAIGRHVDAARDAEITARTQPFEKRRSMLMRAAV